MSQIYLYGIKIQGPGGACSVYMYNIIFDQGRDSGIEKMVLCIISSSLSDYRYYTTTNRQMVDEQRKENKI